jgi:hypothetical protein
MRVLTVLATAAVAAAATARRPAGPTAAAVHAGAPDVGALLAAARGAPPVLCALAARAIGSGNWGWGRGADAPASPLGGALADAEGDGRDRSLERLAAPDVERLVGALDTDDACVRELAARVLGRQRDGGGAAAAAAALTARLAAPNAGTRATAAFALGLAEPRPPVPPLVRASATRPADVRANARGRSAASRTGARSPRSPPRAGDADARCARPWSARSGQFESTSTGRPPRPRARRGRRADVRRVAAWGLGTLDETDGAPRRRARRGPRPRRRPARARDGRRGRSASARPRRRRPRSRRLRGDASDAVRETGRVGARRVGDDEGATPRARR